MDKDKYLNLIYKKLSTSLSASEEADLHSWLVADEANHQMLLEVEKTWEVSGQLNAEVEVDLKAEFDLLESRIETMTESDEELEEHSQPAQKRSQFGWKTWSGIAAGIAILAMAGFFGLPLLSETAAPEWIEILSGNAPKSITLADGSLVTLNKNSSLKYPKEADPAKRTVQLSGEAFFSIVPNVSRPFSVLTKAAEITVLGTSFNVRAIPEEKETEVHVATGKVRFNDLQDQNRLFLLAGESGRLNVETHTLHKAANPSENEFAWFSHKLVFRDSPLSKVISELEKLYGIQLALENPDLEACPFTATFKERTAEEALETLITVLGITLEKTSQATYRLKGGTCD